MNEFIIVPDSSCDMSSALRKRYGIDHLLYGVVYPPDGSQIPADVDWENITPEEYYNSMRGRKILYKTATPPVGEIISTFEQILQSGKDILSISLSSGISGTYQIVQNTAKQLLEKYPERKIICVDSLKYSCGIALLITLAVEKQRSGATIEETADYLNEIKYCVHQMGSLDDLFFCVKTGRINNIQAFFGTLVGVNSLGDFSNKGLAAMLGKVKGKQAALNAIVAYIKETIKNPQGQTIFIAHSIREEQAKLLAERIQELFNPKEIIIAPVGMTCGSSIGPGMCAAFYIGTPISDNEVNERKILNNIIAGGLK